MRHLQFSHGHNRSKLRALLLHHIIIGKIKVQQSGAYNYANLVIKNNKIVYKL